MARPRKALEDQRTRVLSVRLTASEYARIKTMARDAGMLPGPYARTTILDRRPRSKPLANLVFKKLIYELHSIATNCRQLADATGNQQYLKWAKHVGGRLVERLISRNDLSELMEQQLEPLNAAGHIINSLAHQANATVSKGKAINRETQQNALRTLKFALQPLEDALSKNSDDK